MKAAELTPSGSRPPLTTCATPYRTFINFQLIKFVYHPLSQRANQVEPAKSKKPAPQCQRVLSAMASRCDCCDGQLPACGDIVSSVSPSPPEQGPWSRRGARWMSQDLRVLVLIKSRLFGNPLTAANDVQGVAQASSGDFPPPPPPAEQTTRAWQVGQLAIAVKQKRADRWEGQHALARRQCERSFRQRADDAVAPGREEHRKPRSDPAVPRRRSRREPVESR